MARALQQFSHRLPFLHRLALEQPMPVSAAASPRGAPPPALITQSRAKGKLQKADAADVARAVEMIE